LGRKGLRKLKKARVLFLKMVKRLGDKRKAKVLKRLLKSYSIRILRVQGSFR